MLALASSPEEKEALAAAKKARELMANYNIFETDVEDTQEKENVVDLEWRFVNLRYQQRHETLAWLVFKNFRCQRYNSVVFDKESTKIVHTMHFIGLEQDAQAAYNLYTFLVAFIDTGFKYFLKKDKKNNPQKYEGKGGSFSKAIKNCWVQGFLLGLQNAFDKQNKEDTKYEMMCIIPNAV